MVLPAQPYRLHVDPLRVPALLDVLFLASAPVHPHYDGERTWSALVGLGAVHPSLVSGDLEVTGRTAVQRLSRRLFSDHRTAVRKVSAADHAVDGRPGVLVTGQVHYAVPGLRSRFDRVTALVIRLDDGTVVTALTLVPDDAPATLTGLAEEALTSVAVN